MADSQMENSFGSRDEPSPHDSYDEYARDSQMDDESLRDTQTQYEYGRDSQMDDESLRETQTQYDYGRDSQTEDGYPKDSQMESGDYGRDSQTEDGYRRDSQTQYDYGRDSHTQDGYPRDSQMNDSFWNRGESVSYEPRDGYGSSASRSVSPDEQPKLDPVTASLLDQLREELEKESKTTIFTCGGTIPITKPDQSPSTEDANDLVTSEPITVRWDPASANALAAQAKLVLPLEPETRENLQRLLRDTEPASFGYHGKNVYDEAYRKALKMDTAKFATTFNPYELGIIDTIAQVLLPSTPDDRPGRAVKAELYKLNVYSSPSGKFKPHVDTPRGNSQIGSLVVCLPLPHEGGQLQIRHKGEETTYDWGAATNEISWAAFYSDCEHEVLKVKSGHRITLTYNLYAVRRGGVLSEAHPNTLDMNKVPLYQSVKDIVVNKYFMPDGGYLGFYCSHAYPHTSTEAIILPEMLKGLDMVMWEIFGRLGLEASVKPVLRLERYGEEDQMIIGSAFDLHLAEGLRIEEYHEMDEMINEWRCGESLDSNKIQWLTKPNHKQLQLAYIAYGNQESLASFYSYCAIIVTIPSARDRTR